jgi:outer membrane protein assembly factor BamB
MDGYLYAVKNGVLVWQVKTKGQVNSSPAIGVDGTVYAMSDDGSLYAVK